jgi:hypothetical protein
MAMPVMVMAVPVMVMMMAVMTMAMASSVVAVASSVPAMATMAAAVTAASESLTWNGQWGSRQRQSSDSDCYDFLDPGHACLLSCAIRGLLCPDPT